MTYNINDYKTRHGQITSVSPLEVEFYGEEGTSRPIGQKPADYVPTVGDVVLLIKSGVQWVIVQCLSAGASLGVSAIQIVTSTTRPSAPIHGQGIYELDTDRVLWWDGTVWRRRGVQHTFGPMLAGATPTATQLREMEVVRKSGSTVASSGAGGGFTVTFPEPFPNGLASFVPGIGSGDVNAGLVISSWGHTLSKAEVRFRTSTTGDIPTSQSVRVNWEATGW